MATGAPKLRPPLTGARWARRGTGVIDRGYDAKVKELGDPAEADALRGKPTTTLAEWCTARAGRG